MHIYKQMGYNPRNPGRKYFKKKRSNRRRGGKRSRVPRPLRSGGKIVLARKLPEMSVYGYGAGWNKVDPTGTCLTFGAPVANTSYGSTNNTVPFVMVFRLDQLINYTELTALTDRYKFLSVNLKIRSTNNIAATTIGASDQAQLPWFEFIEDHDDATMHTINGLRERMNVKTRYFGSSAKPCSITVRPRVADVVYNNGVTTAYAVNAKQQWINCSYPSVEHYAIRGNIHNVNIPAGVTYGTSLCFDVTANLVLADIC